MTEAVTIRNGIDVDQLLATIEAMKDDPAVGTFTFRASSRWQEGTTLARSGGGSSTPARRTRPGMRHSSSRATSRRCCWAETRAQTPWSCYCRRSDSATPSAMRPTLPPVESSSPRWSTSSKATSTCAHSSAWTVPRAGFTEIRARGWVSSPNATKAQLVELCQYMQDTSPVRDSLANPSDHNPRGPLTCGGRSGRADVWK
jgi:hypothetical protein